ncbi:MAG: WbuC family cupin fold metalloprotein [Gammaproteobacteria bacterium]|nr:WbuC family cupin fold metalloprotein [Gammaproteobacteria bacterium]
MERFDQALLATLADTAANSVRRRANHNIHPRLDDPVQRFFNAMQPDTYVRPHRHCTPPRWELFLVLRGRLALLTFAMDGRVIRREEICAAGPVFGVEVPEATWHALVALEPSIVFELKEGPYHALSDKDFAQWAPAEGDSTCAAWVNWYRLAQPGDMPPVS